jgi:hypothetical protein
MNDLGAKLRVFLSLNIFTLIVALPFLGVGLYEAVKIGRILQTYERIEGTVTGNSYVIDSEDNSGAYLPNVTFQPEDSRPIQFTDGIGTYPARYSAGDKVAVLYNPTNPSDARINSWVRLWVGPLIFIIVGSIPLLINLLFNYLTLVDMRRAKP